MTAHDERTFPPAAKPAMHRHPADPPLDEQGALRQADGSVVWRVWAPYRRSLELVLLNPRERRVVPMSPAGGGYYAHQQSGICEGQRYAYQVPERGQFPDPASRWQPEGVHNPSAVFFPDDFVWTDGAWRGIARQDLVIYELHVGTFTPEGTFAAVATRLDALRELGVTAIEIMPVAQFPGSRNWGYDGVYPYAAQQSYGGPRELQRLVDTAHAAGMAVLLDVVYNHLGPEGNYLSQFGPYFTDRYHTPWGQALNYDGADSEPVRRLVTDNARMWVRDFHVDGLRLDAVQEIYDFGPRHILADIAAAAHQAASEAGRTVHVIAETDQDDVKLVRPVEVGGDGLDGVWSDDFHHSVHALLTGEHDGYYADFGTPDDLRRALVDVFVYDGRYSHFRRRRHGTPVGDAPRDQFVVSIQNHDQVGNRAESDRFGQLLAPAAQRLACALMLLAPNVPLLFMGEEYGETRPFPFFCSFEDRGLIESVRRGRRAEFAGRAFRWRSEPLDPQDPATFEEAKLTWSWPEGSVAAGIRQLYADLLLARRNWPALRDRAHTAARIEITEPGGNEKAAASSSVLVLGRGRSPGIVAAANLGASELPVPSVAADLSEAGSADAALLLSTEDVRYGGRRRSLVQLTKLAPYELVVWGPDP